MKNIDIDNIKVSKNLDDVIDKAINEGYYKKKNKKYQKNIVVAAIAIIITIGVVKSDFVSATISKLKNTIESFSINENPYIIPEEYKTIIGKTIEDKNIKITLNEFYIDKNLILFTTNLDSSNRIGYAQSMNTEIYIDGKLLDYTSSADTLIHNDDGTVDILTTIYYENLNISKNSNIIIKFNDILVNTLFEFEWNVKGNWQYNFNINNDDFSNKIITKKINQCISINDTSTLVNEITISPNIVILNTEYIDSINFIIKDDKGNEYLNSSGFGFDGKTMNYIFKINTTDIHNITLIPKSNMLDYDKSIKIDIK
ncbi:DUF4179 domain-containing protein [uncultured Clostridium sp.]|uniref:DUF4179 domain-containing protein n=1 Tax=uncultured Clostridium sp. TaxID=59620 RepID=UPI00261E0D54|nr:DUF4179 domain-containing protein [uncultured Clostridium sp.]